MSGRTDTNKTVIIPNIPVANDLQKIINKSSETIQKVALQPGDYVIVKIESFSSHSLKGIPISKTSLIEYNKLINLL